MKIKQNSQANFIDRQSEVTAECDILILKFQIQEQTLKSLRHSFSVYNRFSKLLLKMLSTKQINFSSLSNNLPSQHPSCRNTTREAKKAE